jgi:tetratricopeptide (TPR) repeat protein
LQHVYGFVQYSYGELLNRIYQLTDDDDLQNRAIQALKDAAETFRSVNTFSRVAECYWKIGRLYGDLRVYFEAAEHFTLASTYYTRAIERVPQLKEFYRAHASYMEAWSEIEQAQHLHKRRRYEQAQHHYARAATLHQSTKWSYLSPNYAAWACLEAAESTPSKRLKRRWTRWKMLVKEI